MSNDAVDTLKAQLAGLTGAARTRPLLELAQALAARYWRSGPGSPAGLPDLSGAVEALDEAYGYLDADDTLRAQVASQLGWLLGARHLAHGGPERDRATAVRLLEEALAFPQLPPALRTMARMVLGQLYLSRLARRLQSSDFAMEAMRSGVEPAEAANANRAVDCFRRILAEAPMSADITNAAQAMLTMAEAMQTMMSGFGRGPGGMDLSRMMEAVAALQKLQQQAGSGIVPPGATLPSMPSLFDADKIAQLDPLDRPVAVVEGPEPAASAVPRAPRREALPADPTALRLALRDKLAKGADLYESIECLLGPNGPQPEFGTVDDLVALAASVVHGGGSAGTDHLLLAVALYLRSRIDDGGGWEDDTGGDAQAAAENLLVAADRLPAEQPDAVPAALRLATLLDERNPSGRVCEGLADRFGDVTDALRMVGADALAYPQPDGVLLVEAAGRLRFLTSDERLPQRVLVVGDEPLPLDKSVVSYVASSAQLTDVARRTRMWVTDDPVFVANPRGDREPASVEAMLLRRRFYPWSTGLGRTVENVDGSGTPDEVLARLSASMLHLGCGVSAAGALELAGSAELGPKEIAASPGTDRTAGGVAILPPVRDGFPTLADAFLAAGFVGVVGWLRPVPDPVAALMLFVLHAQLVDQRLDPAAAVRAVRQWMRDPARKPLSSLPVAYAATVSATDLTDPAYWSALVHRGV